MNSKDPKQQAYEQHRRDWAYSRWVQEQLRHPYPGDEVFHPANDGDEDGGLHD